MDDCHFYILWMEKRWPRTDKKLKSLTIDENNRVEIEYTLSMTDALRIKPEHRDHLIGALAKKNLIFGKGSWIKISYAPTGTIWKPKRKH